MASKTKRYKPRYNVDIESLLSLPGRVHVYWKDVNGFYLGCNDLCAKRADLASREDIVGTKDDDIPYDVAHIAVEQDKEVIKNQSEMLFFNTANHDNNVVIDYFTIKTPLLSVDNSLVGVVGVSYYLSEYTLNQNSIAWNSLAENGITFSKRQVECLYYLVNGMTCKKIAKTINLSFRTVERYIDLTKYKLKCNSQSELIQKALKLNFIKESLIFGKLIYPIKNIKKKS